MFLRRVRPLAWALLGSGAVLVSCADDTIVDNWGPPSGYATLAGMVRRQDGAATAGVEVGFTSCDSPVGGFLAAATTDATGRFRVAAQLPPLGPTAAGITDTLRLRCYVFLNRVSVVRDSVRVRFAPTAAAAPITTVDLVIP